MSPSTDLQQPRLGCGAVIQRADGAILLVQRGRPPEQGHWGLPGGKVAGVAQILKAKVTGGDTPGGTGTTEL